MAAVRIRRGARSIPSSRSGLRGGGRGRDAIGSGLGPTRIPKHNGTNVARSIRLSDQQSVLLGVGPPRGDSHVVARGFGSRRRTLSLKIHHDGRLIRSDFLRLSL